MNCWKTHKSLLTIIEIKMVTKVEIIKDLTYAEIKALDNTNVLSVINKE